METPYAARVRALREKIAEKPFGALMVFVGENRRYLTGFTGEDTQFDESAGCLFVTEDRLLLATDSRFTTQAETECPDCEVFLYRTGLAKSLAEILDHLGVEKAGFESVRVSVHEHARMAEELAKAGHKAELVPSSGLVEGLRVLKDETEISAMRRALELVERVFAEMLDLAVPGATEKELAWQLEKRMREAGAEALSFPCIVATGTNAAMPHAIPSDRTVRAGEPLLFDWGAVLDGYCSDISRTLCPGGADDTFRAVHATVLEAQARAIREAGPGKTTREVDAAARDYIAAAGYAGKFGHGLGHGVGLAVHEDPRVGPTRDTVLEPGMVFTVEPGIYLPEWGGVRIENIVAVREHGVEVLNTLPEDVGL